jgi:hypothetical protein
MQFLLDCLFDDAVCSHILECIAGGCPLHVDPACYSFDAVSAVASIRASCCRSNDRSAQHMAARVHAVMAYSCFLRYTINLIALDVSETELALCLDAAQSAASRDCGRELPLSFMSKAFADCVAPHDAVAFGDLNEADMHFLHEYSSAPFGYV